MSTKTAIFLIWGGSMACKWTEQEIECLYAKRNGGCKACSIRDLYQLESLKECKMFKFILIKFSKYGFHI